jgi:hypothetical protein
MRRPRTSAQVISRPSRSAMSPRFDTLDSWSRDCLSRLHQSLAICWTSGRKSEMVLELVRAGVRQVRSDCHDSPATNNNPRLNLEGQNTTCAVCTARVYSVMSREAKMFLALKNLFQVKTVGKKRNFVVLTVDI